MVMSNEEYEHQQELMELFTKLDEADAEIAGGAEGEDFAAYAESLRRKVRGTR